MGKNEQMTRFLGPYYLGKHVSVQIIIKISSKHKNYVFDIQYGLSLQRECHLLHFIV